MRSDTAATEALLGMTFIGSTLEVWTNPCMQGNHYFPYNFGVALVPKRKLFYQLRYYCVNLTIKEMSTAWFHYFQIVNSFSLERNFKV